MTQVSRFPLPKTLETQMFDVFYQALANLRTQREVAEYLDDLLTPTEKMMLGKRLAIAILLAKGYNHRTIRQILHVSLSTISTVHYWLKNKGGGYRSVIGKMLRKEQWAEMMEKLDHTLEKFFTMHKTAYHMSSREEHSIDRL